MKANPVKDQKVFVKLNSVLELQKEYLRLVEVVTAARDKGTPSHFEAARARGIEWVIKTLDLPISIHS